MLIQTNDRVRLSTARLESLGIPCKPKRAIGIVVGVSVNLYSREFIAEVQWQFGFPTTMPFRDLELVPDA